MKRSHINILFLVIEILLLFACAFWVKFIPFRKSLYVYILSLIDCFLLIFNFFVSNDKLYIKKNQIMDLRVFDDFDISKNTESSKDQKSIDEQQSIKFDRILYSLQMIEVSSRFLNTMDSVEKRITAARIINDNVKYIKKIIGAGDIEEENSVSHEIPFELSDVSVESSLLENITVAIYGPNNEDNFRLRLILQSYGFFCMIISKPEEILFSIEDKVIQFLIIQPRDEKDDVFFLCQKIREKHTLLDFPILVLINKYRSYLVQQCYDSKINDFIIQPFDVSELITRIVSLSNYRKMYRENASLVTSEQEKRTFLYFVTHNVNTPLTILLNEIHELTQYEMDDERFNNIVVNIQESTSQINTIIQNVLNSYRISDGRMMINQKIVDLKEFIDLENVYLSNKSKRKRQSFITQYEMEDVKVFCDENSLKCIYVNLVDNAIKYAPIEGKIVIKVFNEEDYTLLQVLDNGRGIPKEKQVVIFNRFANIGTVPTGKEKSLGLGLHVVKEISTLNGLELSYTENPEEESGSCFTVKFPRLS